MGDRSERAIRGAYNIQDRYLYLRCSHEEEVPVHLHQFEVAAVGRGGVVVVAAAPRNAEPTDVA